ncbi:MAG: hypothetical protein ACJAXA_001306 [Candidatus Aldehydirespiratoraceae bacterium]|jgi:hypothetical protein
MAWDASRPVPWNRLIKEWLIYVGVMAALLAIFFRDNGLAGALAGVLISGPLYLFFGFIMAKFGYQRKSLKELRTPQASSSKSKKKSSEPDDEDTTKRPPGPTKRTSGGGNRPSSKQRRR